ncbi:MAG: ECF transporter S component [Firmicutes bacterium]|nr:ECF transporter S component [Bacillota bacterium]
MKGWTARELAIRGLFASLVIVATAIRVPAPTFNLYFNLGEAMVYLTALLFGPASGGIVSALGSGLADILLGYPVWAPVSFVVKGLEGLVVGAVAQKYGGKRDVIAILYGAPVMLVGYALAAGLLYGLAAVPVELGGDLIQVTMGGLTATFLARALRRFEVFQISVGK